MSDSYDRKLERYSKIIPPMYKPMVNEFVTALLKAWAESDSQIELDVQEAKNQIFVNAAEGNYLDALGDNVGVARPQGINLDEVKYRELIPILSFHPKQIRKTFYDILDVFWGPLYSRANITAQSNDTYNLGAVTNLTGTVTFENGKLQATGSGTSFTTQLQEGDYVKYIDHDKEVFVRVSAVVDNETLFLSTKYTGGVEGQIVSGVANRYIPRQLVIKVDNIDETFQVFIEPHEIENTQAATAEEVAASINSVKSVQDIITASVIEDPINKLYYLNLRTNTPGLLGAIHIQGGDANPFAFFNLNGLENAVRVVNIDAIQFDVGDEVIIIDDNQPMIKRTILEINTDDPEAGTTSIIVGSNFALDGSGNNIYTTADYFSVGDIVIIEDTDTAATERTIVTINSDTPSAGIYEIVVDGASDMINYTTANDANVKIKNELSSYSESKEANIYLDETFGFKELEYNISKLSQSTVIFETNPRETIIRIPASVPALRRSLKGSLHVKGSYSGDVVSIDNINKRVTVDFDYSVVENLHEGNKFAQNLEEFEVITNTEGQTGVVLQFDLSVDLSNLNTDDGFSMIDEDYIGAFIFDPDNASYTVHQERCVLDQDIVKGNVYTAVSVEDASRLPTDSGHVMFDFGKQNEEQPIIYLGRISNTGIRINPAYTFQKNHSAGEMINMITLSSTTPAKDGVDYAAFSTGIEEARQAVQDIIESAKAAGVFLRFIITYPDYNFEFCQDRQD